MVAMVVLHLPAIVWSNYVGDFTPHDVMCNKTSGAHTNDVKHDEFRDEKELTQMGLGRHALPSIEVDDDMGFVPLNTRSV